MRNPFTPLHKSQSIAEAIREGQQILAENSTQTPTSKPTMPHGAAKAKPIINAYRNAWEQVMGKKSIQDQMILEKMAAGDLLPDRRFDEFIKEVIRTGDQLSA